MTLLKSPQTLLVLSKAVYNAIKNLSYGGKTIKVLSKIPELQIYPYVRIGEKTEIPFDTHTREGGEDTFTLHIWSNLGDLQCLEILEVINGTLADNAGLTDPDGKYRFSGLNCEFLDTLTEQDKGAGGATIQLYHLTARYRVIVERISA